MKTKTGFVKYVQNVTLQNSSLPNGAAGLSVMTVKKFITLLQLLLQDKCIPKKHLYA